MKLSSLLSTERIILGLEVRTLHEAIAEILKHAEKLDAGLPVPAIIEKVLEREAQGSTAMEHGIAIPHARISGLRDFHLLLGIPAEALEDKCHDGTPVNMVFLITSSDQKNTTMLQTMAAIAGLSKDAERLRQILEASSRKAVWQVIDDSGAQVKKGIFAQDLMRPAAVVAYVDMTLKELLDGFFEHGVRYAPVCSPEEKVVGGITSAEIIDAGLPEYMSTWSDLGFLGEYEPFEGFFKQEASIRVQDIMNPQPVVVDIGDPLIQVVFQLKKTRQAYAYVQQNDRFAGVIERNDIVLKILRA